jgi:DNA-binding XRE family transcriptional regulator
MSKCGRKKSDIQICGKSVTMHRQAHMMTQIGLAKKIGVCTRTLQRIENEPEFRATPVIAYKIAYELIFNPAPINPKVTKLINSWNNR